MKKKIVLTRGLPASGKSTWSGSEVVIYNALTITKDDIRIKLGITKDNWSKTLEADVVKEERTTVEDWARMDVPYIIVDNTHLGKNNPHVAFYSDLADKYGYDFEIIDFPIAIDVAIERDKSREKTVGEDVIVKMSKIAGKNSGLILNSKSKFPDNPEFTFDANDKRMRAFIFDIDGTLAFMKGKRSPYDFKNVGVDEPNHYLINLLNLLQKNGNKIIVVSGRDGVCAPETELWLHNNGVYPDEFYMRGAGDNKTPDTKVKKTIYNTMIKDKYYIMGVFDDRNKVVDMWRNELNLPTYQVWYGDF